MQDLVSRNKEQWEFIFEEVIIVSTIPNKACTDI